jgi:hypothetical protein
MSVVKDLKMKGYYNRALTVQLNLIVVKDLKIKVITTTKEGEFITSSCKKP